MSAGHQDSGQNDLWKDLQQRIEAVTGPSIWPVPAGLAVGAALLGVVALSQPPDTTPAPASISSPVSKPSTAKPATSARKPDVPRPAGRINRLSPKPSGGVQGLLLPTHRVGIAAPGTVDRAATESETENTGRAA